MMKSAIMLFAALAMAAVSAAEIDVNGAFKVSKPGQKLPDKWVLNLGPKLAGSHELIKVNGKNAVTIKATEGMYGIVYTQKFPVKPGERYALSVNAAGSKGRVNVGLQLVSPKKYLMGNYDKNISLTGKTVSIKRVITIPEKAKGETPTAISVLFLVWAPGEATFDTFKLEKLD